jgi:hypothetical protein
MYAFGHCGVVADKVGGIDFLCDIYSRQHNS